MNRPQTMIRRFTEILFEWESFDGLAGRFQSGRRTRREPGNPSCMVGHGLDAISLRVNHKGCIIVVAILWAKTRRPIASSAMLQCGGMKASYMLGRWRCKGQMEARARNFTLSSTLSLKEDLHLLLSYLADQLETANWSSVYPSVLDAAEAILKSPPSSNRCTRASWRHSLSCFREQPTGANSRQIVRTVT